MKISFYLLLIFFFVFSSAFVVAQEETEEEVPPGMEIIKINDTNVIAIKGTKIKKKGDLLVIEGTKEFVARKLLEIDSKFSKLEEKNKSLEKEINNLKETLTELKENTPTETLEPDEIRIIE